MPTLRRPIRALVLAVSTAGLVTGLLTAGATAATPPAAASPDATAGVAAATFFVAPDGAGERCTRAEPCSLDTAQQKVRAATSDMTGDIVVNLLGGQYRRTEPWVLSAARGDSGAGRHRVVYQAADYGKAAQAEPVISGGREIDGWEQVDAERNLWRAPVGDLRTRQLYVDDRRAVRESTSGLARVPSLGATIR